MPDLKRHHYSIYNNTGEWTMDEILILAVAFNILLLFIAYFSGSRAVVIICSIVWVLIGFMLFETYEDTLLLAILYMIAFAELFIPLKARSA